MPLQSILMIIKKYMMANLRNQNQKDWRIEELQVGSQNTV